MAPYRQFVVTFPIPMRYGLHSNREMFSKVYRIIIKEIHSYYKIKAPAAGIKDAKSGAISFTKIAASALNLHPHLHILFCDGVFSGINQNGAETFLFRNLEAITDKEVEKLLVDISSKFLKLLKKHGFLNHEGEMVSHNSLKPTMINLLFLFYQDQI